MLDIAAVVSVVCAVAPVIVSKLLAASQPKPLVSEAMLVAVSKNAI